MLKFEAKIKIHYFEKMEEDDNYSSEEDLLDKGVDLDGVEGESQLAR